MDERQPASNSRKRHRSEDISAPSYRLAHSSSAMPDARNSRLRPVSQQGEADLLIPPTSDPQAAVLEPLHPPIPNFSAISQGAPRPNTIPHSSTEHQGGMMYNIALPLPNPGRAHRFCQACDHVNHVRRKLCTNCGAPKPSAVRNAVGVRSITEVETAARRPQGDTGYKPDGYPQVAPGSSQYPGVDMQQHRFNPHNLGDDQRFQRPVDLVPHQARSLAMRCPGDDIPLLGNPQKVPLSGHPDSHVSRRIRSGQAILSEPLLNLNSLQSHDGKNPVAQGRHNFSNMDFNQKVFPNHTLDREYLTLPSMQGVSNPKIGMGNMAGGLASSRAPSTPRGPLHVSEKATDDSLPEEVLPINRGAMGQVYDTRQGTRRYPNVHGLRQMPRDITELNQIYPGVAEVQRNPNLLYRQGQDFFQPQQQFRPEERDQVFRTDMQRGETFYQPHTVPGQELERGFPLQHQQDINRLQPGTTRNQDQLSPSAPIPGIGVDRSRPSGIDPRTQASHLNLSAQKPEDHLTQPGLEEATRNPDDGRFAIENILMTHKNTGEQNGQS